MKRFVLLIGLGGVGLTVSGCSWVALAAKESALSVTGRNGFDRFTLAADMPAEFGLKAIARYGPVDSSASCMTDNFGSDRKVRRSHVQSYEQLYIDKPQSFAFKIPLTYSIGLCKMELGVVDLKILGRHGPKDWQNIYANGSLRLVETLPEGVRGFEADGTRLIVGRCYWLFQQSHFISRYDEIEKLLMCKGAGAYLQYDQLAGKTVRLAIEVNPEERPSHTNTWIKFHNGWKPCLPREGGWIRCQQPPVFKTFKMDGKTCTVYPGCTE